MTDTTTIEIPADQRDELQRLKAHDREPYYEVIDRLLHATDPSEEASDIADQLDRIEDAAREATNAAQNAERAAEELAGQR